MGKLERCLRLLEAVQAGLSEGCSPEQIAARLPVGHPDDMEMRISPETIYQSVFVQARGELRRQLKGDLRSGRTRRRERGAPERRGRVAKSLTWDKGRELAAHKPFSEQTGIQVYFLRPALALATRIQREHQRVAASIPPEGQRPSSAQPGRARQDRRAAQPAVPERPSAG